MVTVFSGQSLLDIAVQTAGSADAVILLALANNISITDGLEAGGTLLETGVINRPVADYFRVKSIKPTTNVVNETSLLSGIGTMTIAESFII